MVICLLGLAILIFYGILLVYGVDNMKKSIFIFSIIMYVISGIIFVFYLGLGLFVSMSEVSRLVLLGTSGLFLYFGGCLLSKYLGNKKPMKISLYILFGMYLLLLITLTLFDSLWLRDGVSIKDFSTYIKEFVNLVPFKTILTFIGQFDSMYSTRQIFLNLFGNFIAFMPMALFLPLLFKRQRKFGNFVLTMFIFIFGIEVLQLITRSGRFDIDDFILNLSGVCIAYLILRISYVRDLIGNIFLLKKNKISKKSYIKMGLFVLTCIILFLGIVMYRNSLYNKQVSEYNEINMPSITFEYGDGFLGEDLFYEDEVYEYYLKGFQNDEFYVVVNGKDRFSVKEFLDNSKYNYDIDRLLWNMDYENIGYEIKHKYEHFDITFENVNEFGYSMPSNVTSDIAKLVIKEKDDSDDLSIKNLVYEVNIIPIKAGSETFDINLELMSDGSSRVITKKAKVTVNDDMSVSYILEE